MAAIDIRGDQVTVAFAPKQGDTLTLDDLAAGRRVQRLIGDHRPPVGRAGPWSAPRTDRRDPPTPGAGPTGP
jgi:hypothetical protein